VLDSAVQRLKLEKRRGCNLSIETQLSNASLAREISNVFLKLKRPGLSPALTPQDIADGIRLFRWPGRFEVVRRTSTSSTESGTL
jgi:folylpolyglutamate synthase/dihydropteroate synthase